MKTFRFILRLLAFLLAVCAPITCLVFAILSIIDGEGWHAVGYGIGFVLCPFVGAVFYATAEVAR